MYLTENINYIRNEYYFDDLTGRIRKTKCGSFADTLKNYDGYRVISIKGRQFRAHRMAWAMYYNTWPDGQIDHINGNRSDNRISNLRVTDHVGNGKNRRVQSNNASGISGVNFETKRNMWRCRISKNGKRIELGFFQNLSDAISARRTAEKRLGYSGRE